MQFKSNDPSILNSQLFYSDEPYTSTQTNQNTDINKSKRCWNCWDDIPVSKGISVPYKRTNENQFVFHGKFCSLGCAKRYILNTWSHQSLTKMIWLNEVASEVFQIVSPELIPPSPPVESLQELGGPLTREAYRDMIEKGRRMKAIQYPLLTFPMKLYEEEKCVDEAAKTFATDNVFEQYVQQKECKGVSEAAAAEAKSNTKTKKPRPRSKPKSRALPNPKAKAKTKPKSKAKPKAKAKPKPKTKAKSKPKPRTKTYDHSSDDKVRVLRKRKAPTEGTQPYRRKGQNTLLNYVVKSA